MNKLIIFCRHAVETLEYFSKELAEAFENRGYEVFWMDLEMPELSVWKLRQAVREKEAVLVTFNFIGLSGEEGLWEPDGDGLRQVGIWETEGIRCLNIMVDHPLYYYEQLQYLSKDIQLFCIDRDHVAYMKRFYPALPCEFLPSAGNRMPADLPEIRDIMSESYGQWAGRPYPVVFTANYVPVSGIEKQLDGLEPEYRDFYYEMTGAFVQHPEQDLLTLAEIYMKREMPGISDGELCMAMHTMCAVDLWIRTYFREKTVRILAEGGIPVHLFGKDWEQISCTRPENLIFNGKMVGSADCVQAMALGKIALNTMPWFKDGAHDRIFTAMLQGALALTDDSRYLREQFADEETLVYYDLHKLEELPEQVHRLLREPERMYRISRCGYAAASRYHTWEQRAEILMQFMT